MLTDEAALVFGEYTLPINCPLHPPRIPFFFYCCRHAFIVLFSCNNFASVARWSVLWPPESVFPPSPFHFLYIPLFCSDRLVLLNLQHHSTQINPTGSARLEGMKQRFYVWPFVKNPTGNVAFKLQIFSYFGKKHEFFPRRSVKHLRGRG